MRARGDKTFANTRNATAGTLKLLDSRIVAERPIRAVFYSTGFLDGIEFASHSEELETFAELGLPVPPWSRANSIAVAEAQSRERKKHEDELPFEIDGFVVKINDNAVCKRLGLKTNVPAYAVAYKRPEWFHEATTRLNDIIVQVGRTGILAPVAEVEPVFLEGTVISRITLHNENEIARKDIRIGDTVVIKRAGRVIPAVIRVVDDRRSGREVVFKMPQRCPSCHARVYRRKLPGAGQDEVALRCENPSCPAQLARAIQFFAARAALNIEGLGEIVAEKLVERGLAHSPFDLFRLKESALAALNLGTDEKPRQLGERTARRILDALEEARSAPLSKWLLALGLPSVGESTAFRLAATHRDLNDVSNSPKLKRILALDDARAQAQSANPRARANASRSPAEKAELEKQHAARMRRVAELEQQVADDGLTSDIGPVVAGEILDFFASKRGEELLAQLKKLNIQPQSAERPPAGPASSPFSGKTVVITGTLQNYSRSDAQSELRSRGATVTDSVSQKTDFLVVGADAGSKLDKARKLGVPILTEDEFIAQLTKG